MPMFMDTHEGTKLPDKVLKTVQARVKSGEKDEHGVVDRGVIIDHEARKMHCVLEAPNEDAVMKHHQLLEVPLEHETIHRADAILK